MMAAMSLSFGNLQSREWEIPEGQIGHRCTGAWLDTMADYAQKSVVRRSSERLSMERSFSSRKPKS
jgi:hypothetical protein